MRTVLLLLSSMAFFSCASKAVENGPPLIERVSFDESKLPKDLLKSLKHALSSFIKKEASRENLIDAESFLRSNFIIVKGNCSFQEIDPYSRELRCDLEPRLTIEKIDITDLPFALLIKSLERRLPLQKGYLIDNDNDSLNKTIQDLKNRTASFLKQNGFYDAVVDVNFRINAEKTLIGFNISIKGGSFAKVRNVTVIGDSPISARSILSSYKKMCLSFDKVIEALSIGSNCYNVDLERQTTKLIGEKLAQMGYLENNVRVFRRWNSSRYLDLTIEVEKGPQAEISFTFIGFPHSSQSKFRKFFSSLFAIEYLSKITASKEDEKSPVLNPIYENQLSDEIAVTSIRVIDEAEIKDAADRMTSYLIKKGFAKTEIFPSIKRVSDEKISIHFEINAEKIFRIKDIVISPPHFSTFINKNELRDFLEIDNTTTNHYSEDLVLSAAKNMESELWQKGFKDAEVKVDAKSNDNGDIVLHFLIFAKARNLVQKLIITGASPNIINNQLGFLNNCDNYNPKAQHACHNSSFRLDNLEQDRQLLIERYHSKGYFYVDVKSHYEEVAPHYFNVTFRVFDKRNPDASTLKPISIDSHIILSGNFHTFDQAITRLFRKDTKTDTMTPDQIKKGIAKLRETGRFSLINQKILAIKEKSDDAYLLLQVAEKPSTTFDAIASLSTDRLFNIGFELAEENLFYSMLRMKMAAGFGLFIGRTTYFSNRIMWPRMFGTPLSSTITAPSFAYEDLTHLKKPARRMQTKISAQVDYRTSSALAPYLKYSFIHTLLKEYPSKEEAHLSRSERLTTLDGLLSTAKAPRTMRGVLRPGILFMALDNAQDPKKGANLDIWSELSGGPILGRPPFVVLGFEGRAFVPVKPFTLAFQLSVMRAFMQPSDAHWTELRNASSMDLLGGDRSIRGYNEGAIGISKLDKRSTPFEGYFLNTANFEVRFPLSHEGFLKNMMGALFIDQGILAPVSGAFSLHNDWPLQKLIRQHGFGLSIGASLRYRLPIGPLSLDYGYSPIHQTSRVHILFGYSF